MSTVALRSRSRCVLSAGALAGALTVHEADQAGAPNVHAVMIAKATKT